MKITIEQIQVAVANFYNLPLEEVTVHSRKPVIALPRPIAMFLAREFTGASLREIAHRFECKSYKIVRSSIARIDEQRRTDEALDRALRGLSETLSPTHEALRILDAKTNSFGANKRDDGPCTRGVGPSHRTESAGTTIRRRPNPSEGERHGRVLPRVRKLG
jgi:hypothetical protein